MNPVSALQQQFPLSGRKFWKKMVPKIIISLFFSVVASAVITMIWTSFLDLHTLHPQVDSLVIPIAIGTAVLIFLVVIFLYALYFNAYIRRYYYSTDSDFITIKKGVFTPTEIHVQYQKIQDVYVDQDKIGRAHV